MPSDTSQLRTLIADMQAASPTVIRGIPSAVSKGALNIKNAMQSDFRSSRSFGHIARTVDYDITTDADGVKGEVGPNKSRGGGANLAHIAYWGGANGGGGTVRDPARALEDEAPKFEQALSKLLGDVL